MDKTNQAEEQTFPGTQYTGNSNVDSSILLTQFRFKLIFSQIPHLETPNLHMPTEVHLLFLTHICATPHSSRA